MTPAAAAPPAYSSRVPFIAVLLALAIIPINTGVWWVAISSRGSSGASMWGIFTLLCVGQLLLGLVALVAGIRLRVKSGQAGVGPAVLGGLAAVGAVAGWVLGVAAMAIGSSGGAWGRPLRVRGRQLHPELREGADWTRGEEPDASLVSPAARAALEALWLHDAQKEHASVPAFSRVSWLLAAAGAPAELLESSHRAALEEIEHTRLCFALAAGYGGRHFTVEPMPDLLVGGLELKGNALVVLATESLGDGCQLEDFNADVAAACARACEEPVTKRVLERVAREERTHADFSWAVLAWLLERDFATVAPALRAALEGLARYPRPTAVSSDKAALVARADPLELEKHGRLPDAEWARLWDDRLANTQRRLLNALQAHQNIASQTYGARSQAPSTTEPRA